jgi:hypothetical protein
MIDRISRWRKSRIILAGVAAVAVVVLLVGCVIAPAVGAVLGAGIVSDVIRFGVALGLGFLGGSIVMHVGIRAFRVKARRARIAAMGWNL